MRKFMSLMTAALAIGTFVLFLTPSVSQAAVQPKVTTCTDLGSKTQSVLSSTQISCPSLGAPAIWHESAPTDTSHTGAGYSTMHVCTSKNPAHSYQIIAAVCPKYLVSTEYWRAIKAPATPVIISSSSMGYSQIALTLAPQLTTDAPVAYYLVTNTTTGIVTKVVANAYNQLVLSGLSPQTSYAFTVEAVNIDSASYVPTSDKAPVVASVPTISVATQPLPPQVAMPAFVLQYFIFPTSSESASEGQAIRGFTAVSTGGAVASYSISPAPTMGLSFNTTTGSLSGTPAFGSGGFVIYTVRGTNTAGSAVQTFSLAIHSNE